MKLYCKVLLFPSALKCKKGGCKTLMDQYGDHALWCAYGSTCGWRNDSIRNTIVCRKPLKSWWNTGHEPSQRIHALRSKTKALRENGGTKSYELTFIYPFTFMLWHPPASPPWHDGSRISENGKDGIINIHQIRINLWYFNWKHVLANNLILQLIFNVDSCKLIV